MFLKLITRCVKVNRSFFLNSSKTFCVVYDKNFDYFRSNTEYKNSVLHLDKKCYQPQLTGPELSLIVKNHDLETEDLQHLTERKNVMKLTSVEVKDVLFLMANLKIDTTKYATILKYLDEKCALSVERWPLDLSFYVLDAWFIILGHKAFRKHYYSAITNLWGRRMRKCSKYNLILMLYFIGLSKVSPPFLMETIESRMEAFAPEFSDEEWAIACLSFFKTSKRISSELLLRKSCDAAKNLLLKNDRFNVIGILKCLRSSKYYNAELWGILKDYSSKEVHTFNFVECTNFLAVFATQNIYDRELFSSFELQGLQDLNEQKNSLSESEYEDFKTHPSLRSRVKDISRFLWALTSVGHSVKSETVNFLNDIVRQRLLIGEFKRQAHVLIDYQQSLSLAGYYSYDILSSVLNMSVLKAVIDSNRTKPKYQLYFIQKSSLIEEPDFEFDMKNMFYPIPKSLDKDLKEREGFKTILDILNQTSIKNYKCCYLIPHIMISGIIIRLNLKKSELSKDNLSKNKIYQRYIEDGVISSEAKDLFKSDGDYICIEVLDPTVCVKGSTELLGLMKAKIRQLNKLNFKVIALSADEITRLASKSIPKDCEDINEVIGLK